LFRCFCLDPPCCAHFHPFSFHGHAPPHALHSFPTRRSSDLLCACSARATALPATAQARAGHTSNSTPKLCVQRLGSVAAWPIRRSEEHTSELQSRFDLVCRLLLEKKKEEDRAEIVVEHCTVR